MVRAACRSAPVRVNAGPPPSTLQVRLEITAAFPGSLTGKRHFLVECCRNSKHIVVCIHHSFKSPRLSTIHITVLISAITDLICQE
jgi:hypothetical protein